MTRRWLASLAAAGLLAGCDRAPAPQIDTDEPKAPHFVYVSPDPLGVNPFLIMGETGIELAAAAHGATAKILESEDPTTREENLLAAVDDGAEIIVVLGFEFNDFIARLAPEAPEVDFLIVDHCLDNAPANVYCAVFREFDAAFLIGAEAAMLSASGKVGTVAVADIPFLHRYTDGFEAGARHVDPAVEVATRWVGGENPFSDPVRAKEQALALAAGGADYIFAAAAAGNFGVFEAARQEHFFTFGIDIDQCPEAPGHVVDNMMKRVDRVIVDAVGAIRGGDAEPLLVYGLESDGLGVVAIADEPSADNQCLILSHPEVVERIRALQQQIVSGAIGIDDPMGLLR